ncbi:hypothetical protein, partial [Desulfovibrio cuneatus]|uniref:hypothetical protein n=1 Tax=Desulfovibrio cuneatus TaxID=159728 RepID=UPI001B7FF056
LRSRLPSALGKDAQALAGQDRRVWLLPQKTRALPNEKLSVTSPQKNNGLHSNMQAVVVWGTGLKYNLTVLK